MIAPRARCSSETEDERALKVPGDGQSQPQAEELGKTGWWRGPRASKEVGSRLEIWGQTDFILPSHLMALGTHVRPQKRLSWYRWPRHYGRMHS